MSPSRKARAQKSKATVPKPKRKAQEAKKQETSTRSVKAQKADVRLSPADAAAVPIEATKPAFDWKSAGLRILALLAVVGITAYIYSIRDRAEEFAALGYPGIFLVALMANATIFLPAPGLAIIYAMGGVFNPFGVGLAAGVGGALGELSGYLAGFSGQAVIEKARIYERISPYVDKYGAWAILVLSAIPNPFFDVAGVAAGIAKMPMWKFLGFCVVGQIIKMTLFALAGKYSIDWLATLIR